MKGVVVTDTYTRTVATGWGSANTGQAWSTFGAGGTINAADTSTNGTAGLHSVPATNAYRASYLGTFAQTYADVAVDASVAVMPTGGPLELGNLMTRGTSITAYYLFRVQISPAGVVSAVIFNPGGTNLGTVTIPGVTYTAGMVLRIRAQSIGQVHRIKIWPQANTEPVAWPLTVVDSTAPAAGWVGVRSGVASGVTNALPVAFTYDNFAVAQVPDFPKDQLPLTVLAAFGADLSADPATWPWKNITADVRGGNVVITPGRADETSQVASAACSLQLFNDSKAYSAYNPTGPNYPNVKRNTPIWVIVDPATRFFGYANGFVPSWDTSGKQAIVSVSASGILRRLTQGKTPLRSPLYRTISMANPVAHWPLEDGTDATQAASGITGGAPMTVVAGLMHFVTTGPAGSSGSAAPQVSAENALNGPVVGASNTQWHASVWARGLPVDTTINAYFIAFEVRTDNGKIYRFGLQWQAAAGQNAFVARYEAEGETASYQYVSSNATTLDGLWHLLQASVTQSGPDLVISFWLDGTLVTTQTWTGLTIGRPIQASSIGRYAGAGGVSANMKEVGVAHAALFNTAALVNQYQAGLAYVGETATARLTRLCAEQGVPLAITGTSATAMGPQSVDMFVNLLRECEAADLGLLYDGFGPGLGYITRAARYNLPAALTLDMAADPPQVNGPFQPADDDQRNRNLYVVSRKNGSSATYEDKAGPLGTNPLTGIGVYDSSLTVNVQTDGVLPGYAAWLVHMGTIQGFRYPSLKIDLGATPPLVDGWASARLNSRIDVLNVGSKATGHTPGTVSVLDEGYTETLTPFGWDVAANCSPESGWEVAVVGTDRVDTGGAVLAAGITSAAVSFSVTTTAGMPWGFADGAFDIGIDGERMTVTNVTPLGSSPQTFTVTRSINGVVKAHNANAAVRIWKPAVVAL